MREDEAPTLSTEPLAILHDAAALEVMFRTLHPWSLSWIRRHRHGRWVFLYALLDFPPEVRVGLYDLCERRAGASSRSAS